MRLDPIARSGHLTDLGLEGLVFGSLALPARIRVDRHLRQCAICRERLEQMGVSVPPLVSRRALRRIPMAGVVTLAASLLAWIGVSRTQTPAEFVPKGGDELEIWVHDGTGPALLVGDGPVWAGDRLGFRFSVSSPGYAMILAMDDQEDWSVVFPQDSDGSAMISVSEDDLLPVAVRLDDSPGAEWFHGVVCEEPFQVMEALDLLDGVLDPGVAGCTVHTRRVTRGQVD